MKLLLSLLFIIFSLIAPAQTFPESISSNHQIIQGTNIYMIPPTTFSLSTSFKGFQNPEDQTSMIVVVEVPGPFNAISKGFNEKDLNSRGMNLVSKTEVNIADYNGLLINLNQTANGMEFSKHILIYGTDSATTIINGVFLMDSLKLGEKIKKSILSTFIDNSLIVNPREALDYSIDEIVGNLKFKAVMGNSTLLNRDLKTPTESVDKATLIIDKSFVNIVIPDKKEFCISRLQKYPSKYSLKSKTSLKPIEIDNLTGYELFATNYDDEKEEMYQVILFDENVGYYESSPIKIRTQINLIIN